MTDSQSAKDLMKLDDAQKKAVNKLENALSACAKANVHIHNCYGTLVAYNGWNVRDVNDTPGEIGCRAGKTIISPINLDSWADDRHYVHFKEK